MTTRAVSSAPPDHVDDGSSRGVYGTSGTIERRPWPPDRPASPPLMHTPRPRGYQSPTAPQPSISWAQTPRTCTCAATASGWSASLPAEKEQLSHFHHRRAAAAVIAVVAVVDWGVSARRPAAACRRGPPGAPHAIHSGRRAPPAGRTPPWPSPRRWPSAQPSRPRPPSRLRPTSRLRPPSHPGGRPGRARARPVGEPPTLPPRWHPFPAPTRAPAVLAPAHRSRRRVRSLFDPPERLSISMTFVVKPFQDRREAGHRQLVYIVNLDDYRPAGRAAPPTRA